MHRKEKSTYKRWQPFINFRSIATSGKPKSSSGTVCFNPFYISRLFNL